MGCFFSFPKTPILPAILSSLISKSVAQCTSISFTMVRNSCQKLTSWNLAWCLVCFDFKHGPSLAKIWILMSIFKKKTQKWHPFTFCCELIISQKYIKYTPLDNCESRLCFNVLHDITFMRNWKRYSHNCHSCQMYSFHFIGQIFRSIIYNK